MTPTVSFLAWEDVAPALCGFDPAPARALAAAQVDALVAGRGASWRGGDAALEDSLDRALIAEYGAWAAGWRWAASEPGGGGPVRGWCCPRDSLLRADDLDPRATIERVVAALTEWRDFLVELAARFDALYLETGDLPLAAQVERIAARLLPEIVERTGAEDAWYATFTRVVVWCLQSFGHHEARVLGVVAGVVRGHFASWCAPAEDEARETCADLGRAVFDAWRAADGRPDALAAWLKIRGRALRNPPHERPREPLRRDGHEWFIEARDRARDPLRADRMLAALAACRASARRGEPLTFEALASWQAIVLGVDEVGFRETPAFARDECYGLSPDTPRRFAACLADAAGDEALCVRAARVYLDVCFFHPFVDGNARAARLALDHTITRAGLALHAAEPIFVIARDARDDRGAWCLAHVVEHLLGRPA